MMHIRGDSAGCVKDPEGGKKRPFPDVFMLRAGGGVSQCALFTERRCKIRCLGDAKKDPKREPHRCPVTCSIVPVGGFITRGSRGAAVAVKGHQCVSFCVCECVRERNDTGLNSSECQQKLPHLTMFDFHTKTKLQHH